MAPTPLHLRPRAPLQQRKSSEPKQADWLSLTELGRLFGISAVLCGRQLSAAGLRQPNGAPSRQALHQGLALLPHPRGHHRSALWQRQGCSAVLEGQGMKPMLPNRLVTLWADLLEALMLGSEAITTSAEEMASDVPTELVSSVNQELQQRGSGFRVALAGLSRAARPRPVGVPSPADPAADLRRCG